MPKGDKLTLKQRKFVKEYIRTGNGSQAVKLAGYNVKSDLSANATASDNLSKPIIQRSIAKVLDQAGLTDDRLADDLDYIIDRAKDSDKITVADALRGLDMSFKLKDKYPAERKQIETKNLTMTLKGTSLQELSEQLQELLEQSKHFHNLLVTDDINPN